MPGNNTTGQPNTADYSLGRGIVYFGTLDATGRPTAWRDAGNCPDFKCTLNTTTLQHKSSRRGLKVVDLEVVTDQACDVSLQLDECNFENIAQLFSGDENTAGNIDSNAAAIAGVAGSSNVTVAGLGRWYDLYQGVNGVPTTDTSGKRIYDIGGLTTVKDHATGMITYTLGTDYLVDLIMGRIFIIATGAITAAEVLDVVIAANATAKAPNRVRAFTQAGVYVAVKFISQNPVNLNFETEFEFHKVLLVATGDFALISDAFGTMSFKGSAGTNPVADPNSPTLTIRTHSDAHS